VAVRGRFTAEKYERRQAKSIISEFDQLVGSMRNGGLKDLGNHKYDNVGLNLGTDINATKI